MVASDTWNPPPKVPSGTALQAHSYCPETLHSWKEPLAFHPLEVFSLILILIVEVLNDPGARAENSACVPALPLGHPR